MILLCGRAGGRVDWFDQSIWMSVSPSICPSEIGQIKYNITFIFMQTFINLQCKIIILMMKLLSNEGLPGLPGLDGQKGAIGPPGNTGSKGNKGLTGTFTHTKFH